MSFKAIYNFTYENEINLKGNPYFSTSLRLGAQRRTGDLDKDQLLSSLFDDAVRFAQ
jgi:hypothetical protein